MKPRTASVTDLTSQAQDAYLRHIRAVVPEASEIVEVFWWPTAPLTYVWFADRRGERQVASVAWRHLAREVERGGPFPADRAE